MLGSILGSPCFGEGTINVLWASYPAQQEHIAYNMSRSHHDNFRYCKGPTDQDPYPNTNKHDGDPHTACRSRDSQNSKTPNARFDCGNEHTKS